LGEANRCGTCGTDLIRTDGAEKFDKLGWEFVIDAEFEGDNCDNRRGAVCIDVGVADCNEDLIGCDEEDEIDVDGVRIGNG
jgi:hypothetical protein